MMINHEFAKLCTDKASGTQTLQERLRATIVYGLLNDKPIFRPKLQLYQTALVYNRAGRAAYVPLISQF